MRTAASVRLFSPSCRLLWFWNSPRQLSISAWELVPGGQFLVKPKYRLAHKTTQPSLLFSVGQCACSQEAGRGQAWCLTGVTAGGGLRKRAASGVFIVSLAGELFCIFGLEIGTMGFPAGGRCLSGISRNWSLITSFTEPGRDCNGSGRKTKQKNFCDSFKELVSR